MAGDPRRLFRRPNTLLVFLGIEKLHEFHEPAGDTELWTILGKYVERIYFRPALPGAQFHLVPAGIPTRFFLTDSPVEAMAILRAHS